MEKKSILLILLCWASYLFASDQLVPIPINPVAKPAPCINRPIAEYPGVCVQISQFHVLCAGLHRNGTIFRYPPFTDIASEQERHVRQGASSITFIKEYFEHCRKNHIFDFTKSKNALESGILNCTDRSLALTLHIGVGSPNHDDEYPTAHYTSGRLYSSYETPTQVLTGTIDENTQMIWLQNQHARRLALDNDTLQNTYVLHSEANHPMPPVECYIRNRRYELIGVAQSHVYGTPKISFIDSLFRKCMPSSKIMKIANRPWAVHLDAYVRYGNSWYLMDDETRWEAFAYDAQGTRQSDPNRVAQALVRNYPGIPVILVYMPKNDSDIDTIQQAQIRDNGDTLFLQRDTARPALKALFSLASGIALDGMLIFSAATLLSMPFFKGKAYKYGLIGGLSTACISLCTHIQHLYPMIKKTLLYKAGAKRSLLGPRHPVLLQY